MRVTAKVEAADVASSLTPLMVTALLLKVPAALALLAPSVAKADTDRNAAFDREELTLTPSIEF